MVGQFPMWQVSNFEEAFNKFDRNGDGTITANELGTLLEELGQHVSARCLKNMIQEVDSDKNGSIDFQEFLQMLQRQMDDTDFEEKMYDEFRSYDESNQGYITAAQLRIAMAKNCEMITDGEFDEWLSDKQIKDGDKIKYKRFFERKRSIQQSTTQFTPDQLNMYKEAFSRFDRNGDGTISIGELRSLLNHFGVHVSEKSIQNMIDEVDVNGNGFVDYLEFLSLMSCDMGEDTDFEKKVNKEFQQYDKDNEGYVTVSELRDVLGRCCDTMTVGELDVFLYESNAKDSDRINYKQYFTRRFSVPVPEEMPARQEQLANIEE